MTPEDALSRIAFLLERSLEPRYRVQAFRKAAALVATLPEEQLRARADAGTLTTLNGIGKVTATVISEALAGEVPVYLRRLEDLPEEPLDEAAAGLRAALKGDLHSHSEWSDGGSPIREMAETARALGHSYLALTDHSPRLRVANGLSVERLLQQLDVVAELNEELAPFRILTGIEVDILEDGTLDQRPELLDRLDIVVASVHSKLAMGERDMTRRMLRALTDPHVDVLGHVTGRLIKGERGRRGESQFDAARVFVECAEQGVAVEINSRPERLDPPKRLLRLAVEAGCRFSIDSDAHAPGQLDWQRNGCERAVRCGVTADRVINTNDAADLLKITHTAR